MFFLAEAGAMADLATEEVIGQSYNYWGQFVNMLLTLGIILVLIFVSVYFLKRLMRSRIEHLNRSTGIKILERRALNSKSSLYLIDVLGKGIVIAESQAGIQVVTELPADVKVEEKLDELHEEPAAIQESFIQRLKKLAAKNG
ncbi:MAG: flagellar biosynthetic protein FliO [Chlamydiales bacterium]|nr:flagellar biosynthetic protein FliO [Chlamydiales bacterium]